MRKGAAKRNNIVNVGLVLLLFVLAVLYVLTPPGRFRSAAALDASAKSRNNLDEAHPDRLVDNVFNSQQPTKLLDGTVTMLKAVYSDKVVLVVNVASNCGFTELNYRELQLLQDDFGSKGFTVLAAPCNQFGAQEPGSAKEIMKFAQTKGATFPMLDKLEVNGPGAHPLYVALKRRAAVDSIEWNFGKFLVGRGGVVLRYYDHRFPFEIIRSHIKALVDLPADAPDKP
jgi:glutathione peroxidase